MYVLQAVIGPDVLLRNAVTGQPEAVVVSLAQGLAMVPMTKELFDAVREGPPTGRWASGSCPAASTVRSPAGR
ncbi:hypothetical protein [Plantactinospora sonchi]|uniref:Uncharacterized protein n=1 Tax=Plantactinospora sonchi TaxID=1544735 RepID=A0ABU7RRP5_9ACTN